MTNTETLLNRNRQFANRFSAADLQILPKLRTVVLTCGDSRVDPAYILGLELGDAAVIRNNGGRVTPAVIEEVAALSFIVAQIDGATPGPFELIVMHHTHCGAERFADPSVQHSLKEYVGIDVSAVAITDHDQSLFEDIDRLRSDRRIPGYIVVSGVLYDVHSGSIREVIAPAPLESVKLIERKPHAQTSDGCNSGEIPALSCDFTAAK